jgi:hypothetical protein
MEEDASRLLRKVIKTMSAAILWLLFNMTIGIYFGWMFFYTTPSLGNYIFYVFMAGTLVWMVVYLKRLWRD